MLSVKNDPQRRPNCDIKKVKEKAIRLEMRKDSTIILGENNSKLREWYNG